MSDDQRFISSYTPNTDIGAAVLCAPLRIQNPAKHLHHAKKEGVAARYFDIPAAASEVAAKTA